jgi:hypothetical protein
MGLIGVNIGHTEEVPPEILRESGAGSIRTVALPDVDRRPYFERCREHGLSILLVLARESFQDRPRPPILREYRRRYGDLVAWVQPGNEVDLWGSESSWAMEPADYMGLVYQCRDHWPDARLIGAGLASGNPDWLHQVEPILPLLSACCPHPYGRVPDESWGTFSSGGWGFGPVGPFLDAYVAYGLRLIVSEFGAPRGQINRAAARRGESPWWHPRFPAPPARSLRAWSRHGEWAGQMTAALRDHPAVEAAYFFAFHDGVPGFGLLDGAGNRTPAYDAFRREALMAQQQPQQPDPAPTFHVGPGVREVAERYGLEIQGSEWYPDPPGQWSMTPTDRYMLVYVKAAGRVRLLPWSDA